MNERRCEAAIWDSLFGATIRCQKNGHYEHKEKWYCKIHHPPTLRAKIEERDRKFEEQWNAKRQTEEQAAQKRDEMHRKAAAYDGLLDALKAISDPTVRKDGQFASIAIDRFQTIARAAIAKAEGKGEGE